MYDETVAIYSMRFPRIFDCDACRRVGSCIVRCHASGGTKNPLADPGITGN